MLRKILRLRPKIAYFLPTANFSEQTTKAVYTEQMYKLWQENPSKVHSSWNEYFSEIQKKDLISDKSLTKELSTEEIEKLREEVIKIYFYVRSYNKRGHELADLDPLQMDKITQEQSGVKHNLSPELDLNFYGFTQADLDKKFPISEKKISAFLATKPEWTLREINEMLHKIYCGKIGYEYHHLSMEEKGYFRNMIETFKHSSHTNADKLKIFDFLCFNECFSQFLKTKFNTSKRFGIEGCDTFVSAMSSLVDLAAEHKTEHVVFGMAHRGRLHTLATVFSKPLEQIFAEFQEIKSEGRNVWGDSGDVKYHLGTTHEKEYANGHKIRLSILPNPSHLESVNPVVYGKTRAIQDFEKDKTAEKAIGVLIHGDAALAGQGVVYESLQFQDLRGYSCGGIIHVVINNQIGFTTTPREARSSLYCTDIAKAIGAPIFHVNGDDPVAVDTVMRQAFDFRNKYKKDVFVDIVGYRRYGHNELDQPFFTQPLMYKLINETKPVYEKYASKLIAEGIMTLEHKLELETLNNNKLKQKFELSRSQNFDRKVWIAKEWEEIKLSKLFGKQKDTGIPLNLLREINEKINVIPKTFHAHPNIEKIYEARFQSVKSGEGIDFATAESLAFATLLYEGFGVRLSGQDVKRGTFSHRHAVLYDQETNERYTPLIDYLNTDLKDHKNNSIMSIFNSNLSEFGILGFEYGYSITNPNILVCWEAQFGDFANGAQVIIDNYVTSGEYKWGVQSGLVMLLPHGMDGQGPEHSSANMHRFLQAMDDDLDVVNPSRLDRVRKQILESNLQILCCSNAANYFHALRRQMRREFRKPLIMFNSKKLLRLKMANCNINELGEGLRFRRVIEEPYEAEIEQNPLNIEKVVLCTGQVYYDILEKRRKNQLKNVVIIRIEQLAPFPYDHLKAVIQNYKNANFIWCQEEHQNFGAWFYVSPRIELILEELKKTKQFEHSHVHYVGRKTAAASASGSSKIHEMEKQRFLNRIFEKI